MTIHIRFESKDITFCYRIINRYPDQASADAAPNGGSVGPVEDCTCTACLLHYITYTADLRDRALKRHDHLRVSELRKTRS